MSSRDLTEGLLASWDLEEIGVTEDDVDGLVEAGLWHRGDHDCDRCAQPDADGIVIHDFLDYNPTRDEVERRREEARIRQQRRRAQMRHGVTPTEPTSESPSRHTPPVPDPDPADLYGDLSTSSLVTDRAREDDGSMAIVMSVLSGLGIGEPEAVRQTIELASARSVSMLAVKAVTVRILERAERSKTNVAKPQAYVLEAVRQSWAEIQQWIDEGEVPA